MTIPVNVTISARDQFSGVFGKLRAEMAAASCLTGRLASSFAAIGPSIAGALSVTAVVALARATVNGVDALNDLADATGASIENLSALEDIAARTGTSMDTVSTAVIRFNKVLADARPGNDAAAALDAIGLSAERLRQLDPAEALRQTAVALAGFADDGDKARLVQELLGRSVRQVAPLLKDLAEAGKLNATVTTAQAKAAEQFNIELFRLQKSATDLARDLSGPLVSAVNQTIQKFREGAAAGKGFFGTLASEQKRLIGLGNEEPGIIRINERLRELSSLLDTPRRTTLFSGQATALEAERAKLQAVLDKLPNAGGGRGFVVPELVRPSVGEVASSPPKPPKAASNRQAAKAFEMIGPVPNPATLDALRALEGTDSARIAALREQLQQLIAIRAGRGDKAGVDEALRATVEQISRLDPAAREAAVNAQRLQSILGQTPSGKFAAVLTDIELINDAFERGTISAEQWAQAARQTTAQVAAEDAEEQLEKIGTFAEQAGRNIQSALGDSLQAVLAGNFDSIGDLWTRTLQRMAAEALAAELNKALFGSLFGGGGKGGGLLGGLLGSAFGGFFATGGTLGAGRWGIAGEAGPEIVRGPASITPMADVGAGGGGATVQIINHINGDVGPATVRLVEGAMSRVKTDILRSSRTGGAFAGAY